MVFHHPPPSYASYRYTYPVPITAFASKESFTIHHYRYTVVYELAQLFTTTIRSTRMVNDRKDDGFLLSTRRATTSSTTTKAAAARLGQEPPQSTLSLNDDTYFHGFERSEVFEQLFQRLQVLENWKELAIRPSSLEVCDPEDVDLFEKALDDVAELQERCNQVRISMNASLPPIEVIKEWGCCLVAKESFIEGAGLGLFYQPPPPPLVVLLLPEEQQSTNNDMIPKGTVICYYTGHIHNFHSSRALLSDKSYLMMIQGEVFIDAGLCMNTKARFINDPLNESAVNCQFVPEDWRAAVVTTRDILPGEEIFASYGEYYWSGRQEAPGKRYLVALI